MPIIRKVITLRTAKAVCLPKSWFDYYERQFGAEIKEVAIEVNNVLKIRPIFPREANKKQKIGEVSQSS